MPIRQVGKCDFNSTAEFLDLPGDLLPRPSTRDENDLGDVGVRDQEMLGHLPPDPRGSPAHNPAARQLLFWHLTCLVNWPEPLSKLKPQLGGIFGTEALQK